jgi:DNA-dependent RNA polymerase auxiliary subunit epsilon
VKKETGQAITIMAETNEGSTTVMTDEENFHSEYLKKISD